MVISTGAPLQKADKPSRFSLEWAGCANGQTNRRRRLLWRLAATHRHGGRFFPVALPIASQDTEHIIALTITATIHCDKATKAKVGAKTDD